MPCGPAISTYCSGCSDAPPGRPTSGKNFCSRILTPCSSGRQHPLTRVRKITLRELARYGWILPARGAPRREAFERLFAGSAHCPTVRIETSSLDIYKSVLETSNMIALLSTVVEAQLGEALSILPFDSPALARNDGVASRADWQPTLLHQQFLELLRKEAQQYQQARTLPARLNGRLPAQAKSLGPLCRPGNL
jgi:hypothetical protein